MKWPGDDKSRHKSADRFGGRENENGRGKLHDGEKAVVGNAVSLVLAFKAAAAERWRRVCVRVLGRGRGKGCCIHEYLLSLSRELFYSGVARCWLVGWFVVGFGSGGGGGKGDTAEEEEKERKKSSTLWGKEKRALEKRQRHRREGKFGIQICEIMSSQGLKRLSAGIHGSSSFHNIRHVKNQEREREVSSPKEAKIENPAITGRSDT